MKLKMYLLIITMLCGLYTSSFSQENNNSLAPELLSVDFERLNSIRLEDLELQAHLLFLNKDYSNSAKYYLEIIKHNIDDANAYYKLACCYAKLGVPVFAGNFLIMAVNSGYDDFNQIKKEECFKDIENESFKNTLNEILSYGNKFGEIFYTGVQVLVKSRLFLPEGFNTSKKYNLLIGLHGYGGTAENFSFLNEFVENDDFIIVIPEAPYLKNAESQRKHQYSWDFQINDEGLWKVSGPAVMDYILNILQYCNDNYKIEGNYLLGFSQGATYAYATGIKNPDKIDGVIACGGRMPDHKKYPWFLSENDLASGNSAKVCIIHGKNDLAIDYSISLKSKRVLSKFDYDVNFISFEGGHVIDRNSLNQAINWLVEE